jgi:ABC-type bacteriocin/lantibiotic exporter with double-glycine peptidase domain
MSVWIRLAKVIADSIANLIKRFEEQDRSAILLPGIRRSLQLDRYSCGVQSVKVILDYYGRSLPIEAIEKRLRTDKEGTSITAIRHLFKSLGLTSIISVDATLRDIKRAIDLGCPVLVSFSRDEHCGVVYGYSRRAIFVSDSSITSNLFCRLSRTQFLRQWEDWMMTVRLH